MVTVVVYTTETFSSTVAAENIPNHHLSQNTANKGVNTEVQSKSPTGGVENNARFGYMT